VLRAAVSRSRAAPGAVQPVRELHEAPILYISAAKAPKFSTEELDKLREYVWQGGCLFSVTECTGTGFKKGIREVYAKLFPQYELVPAGPDHEIYNAHFKLRGKPTISILSNGVRPLAIHTDVDVSRDWQMQSTVMHKKSFQVAANVFMYVTDYGELRHRGTSHWPTGQPGGGGGIKIVRLKHNGNCNPEPLAHTRFELMMGGAVTVSKPTPIAQLASTDARIALMTGTGRFGLTKADKQAIKDFVTGGGTLVIDAAGGPRFRPDPKAGIDRISGFAAAAERMLEELFGRRSLRPLPATSPILAQVGKVKCRRRTRKRLVGKPPALRVIMVDGRAAVFYSREDITAGLVGYDCATVDGYSPESAFAILRSIVLFASGQTPAGSGAGGGAGSFSPPGKSIAEPTERIEL